MKIYKHITAWVLYFTFIWVYAVVLSPSKPDFLTFIVGDFLLLGIFYFNYFKSFPVFFQQSKVLGIIFILIGLFGYYDVRFCTTHFLLPLFGKPVFDSGGSYFFLANHTYFYILYSSYALLVWYADTSVRNERKLREEESMRLKSENDRITLEKNVAILQTQKSQAELNALILQINPHFLYNTLNTFYSDTQKVLPQTARGIALLSQIMRYSLVSSGSFQLNILSLELEQLKNYIELMQLRHDNKLQIIYEFDEAEPGKHYILPHLLITLAENAFKHGNLEAPIHVRLKLTDNQLDFTLENTIAQQVAGETTGLGLKNIKERLSLWYGNGYTFVSEAREGKYISRLVISNCTNRFSEPDSTLLLPHYNQAS